MLELSSSLDFGGVGKANAVAKAINNAGGQALAIPGDMLNAQYVEELVRKAAEFGGGKIHIIVSSICVPSHSIFHINISVTARLTMPALHGMESYIRCAIFERF